MKVNLSVKIRGAVIAACVIMGLAACVPKSDAPEDAGYGLQGYNPAAHDAQKMACEGRGGEYRSAGLSGVHVCFETPNDAGKYCTASTQCESNCLSRSNTCAPITPLFGCNAILDSSGREVTLCRD